MKPLDYLLLLLLHENQQRRRTVESLIRNKIRSDVFTEKLVITTFQKYITHLKQHTVTVLAEALLESSEDIVVIFAKQMYSSDLSKLRSY